MRPVEPETTPVPPSRAWFALAAFLLFIPAAITCFFEYRIFATWTLRAPGNYWEDGRPVAADFVQFAGVAEAWERGRIDEIYASLKRQAEFFTLAAELPKPYEFTLSFNYPPFALWLLRPLAPLDYMHRFVAWTLMQLCFALAALWCWRKELGPGRTFGVVALGWLVSPPVINNFILGHASFMALGIVSGVLFLLRRRRDFAAGLVLSLLFYKPTLGVVLGPLLVIAGRWRAVLGVLIGAGGLAVASAAASIQACRDYPNIGRELFKLASEYPDYFVRHFNLMGFAATFLELRPVDFTWRHWNVILVPSVVLFAFAAKAWSLRWRPESLQWCAGASCAILTTLVVTPYLFSYDTMLAAIAAVYSIKTWNARPEWHRWFVLGCIASAGYFVWGDVSLMESMQKAIGVRIQLAPIIVATWAAFDGWWAIRSR